MTHFYGRFSVGVFVKKLTYLILNLQIGRYSAMKKGILLLLLVSSGFAHGQSLKDALFSGKLKNKAGTVVRKGDDLTAQADTTQTSQLDSTLRSDTTYNKSTNDSGKIMSAPVKVDTSTDRAPLPLDSTRNELTAPNDPGVTSTTDTAAPETADAAKENAPKNNNVLWKEFIDTVSSTLKTEVLPSKKVKRETYYITVSYTIGTDGQVEVTDVAVSPENSFLKDQVKSRLMADAPRLNPVLSSSGAPRKVNKRHNFTLTKE